MRNRIYDNEQFNKGKWSGGETTEFAIYPENAKYVERDFVWRLSSASVDVEESTFTKLPDYDRILMVLEGEAVLAHGDERTVKLEAGQQDSFGGDVRTKCFGKIRDYNLIMKKGCEGKLQLADVQNAARQVVQADWGEHTHASYGFYCLDGYAVVSIGGEQHMVTKGKQMVVDLEADEKIEMTIMGEGKVIIAEVFYTKLAHAAVEIPEEKATFEDFKTAFKLSKSRTKWKQATNSKKDVWYDEALQAKLSFLDRSYIGIILWVIIVLILVILGVKGLSHIYVAILVVAWTVLYALVISPLIYMIVLPKPIKAHIKDIKDLTEYEQKIYERELTENGMTDKILRKYKHSKGEGWDVKDEDSIVSRLKR